MGPSWEIEKAERAYDPSIVNTGMYAGILKTLAPVDILVMYYTFDSNVFVRGPTYLFC